MRSRTEVGFDEVDKRLGRQKNREQMEGSNTYALLYVKQLTLIKNVRREECDTYLTCI
jgi:hypothetical protein